MVDKLIKDGKVAVIYSPGYGAGWSTWASHDGNSQEMVFDRELAEAVLAEDKAAMKEIADRKWPDAYKGGLNDCMVYWVDHGDRFEIQEYDGHESVRILGPDTGYTA